jgi:hypothetical protein
MTKSQKVLFITIIVLAFVIRTATVAIDLPYITHPDEPVNMSVFQTIYKNLDPNPHFFHYPSLFLYLNALSYLPYHMVLESLGYIKHRSDIPYPQMLTMAVGYTPMPSTFLLGRMLTVLFSLGSVILTFFIAKRFTKSIYGGLLAALMLTFSLGNVNHSRFITPDTYTVFFVLLAYWLALLFWEAKKHSFQHLVSASIAAGFAAGTKYNAALTVLPVMVANFFKTGFWSSLKSKHLYLIIVLTVASFIFTTPFALLDFKTFYKDFTIEVKHYATGHPGMEGNDTFYYYLNYIKDQESFLAPLVLLELLRGFLVNASLYLHLLSFPLIYFLVISRLPVRNIRTLLPVIPFVYILLASFFVFLGRKSLGLKDAKKYIAFTAILLMLMTSIGWQIQQNLNLIASRKAYVNTLIMLIL